MDITYWEEVLKQLRRYGGDEVCIKIAQKKVDELRKEEEKGHYK